MCGSGMLNMEGRGACDPNKFQILFPATSGSSCVQALRPFPTSPSLPFPKDCSLSLPGLPGQPPPPGVRGKSVCHCVCVTLGVFQREGILSPPSFIGPAAPVMPPQPIPGSLWPPRVICSWPHPGVQSGLGRGSWNRWPTPTPPFSAPLPSLHLTIAAAGLGSDGGGLGEGARIRGMD